MFTKIDVNQQTNFKFQITNIADENIELVDDSTKKTIQNIANVAVPRDNKGQIKTFSFNLYKHKLSYGKVNIKFESKDNVITPNEFGSQTKLKIETCEGMVGTIAGMVVNVTRIDELEDYTYLECKFGIFNLDCGFIVLKPTELYQSFHLTFPIIISKNANRLVRNLKEGDFEIYKNIIQVSHLVRSKKIIAPLSQVVGKERKRMA